MYAIPVRCVAPRIEERLAVNIGDRGDALIVLVVAMPLAGKRGVDRVMHVVRPLAIQSVAALLGRTYEPRVVQITFGKELHFAMEPAT